VASVNYIGDDEDLLPPMTDEELAQMRGGVPDPGAALPVGPSVLAAPPIAPPTDSGGPPPVVGPANQALAAELAKQPVLPEPKWWQRLAGAGAGAAAGYSNAAGRTRNPIDLNELSQNILAPGYGQKLAEWKSRVAPLQQAAETETARNQAWWKNAATKAGIDQKAAEAEMQRQHGKYFENRSEMEQNQWKIDPRTGGVYNTITGERKTPPQTPQDRVALAKSLGFDDDAARVYGLTSKLPVDKPSKNLNPTDILLHPGDFDTDTVKRAQGVFDREHKPTVVNVGTGGTEISTPPPAADLPRLKGIANGDIPAPSNRNKNYNQTMDWVYQLDPTYTEGRYLGKKNFQNSKDAQNLGTITRIMGHLDRFDKNSSALGFSPLLGTNTTGAQRRLHIVSNAIAEEFGKLVSGGVLTQDQAKRSEANLLSPIESVRKDALDEVNQLMDSQFEGIYQRYRATTNQDFPTGKYFDNATQQRLQKRGSLPSSSGQSGTGPGEAAPSGAQANPNPNGYVSGHVYGGLTYLGGDPKNKASWK
jgi:hypothetical protein